MDIVKLVVLGKQGVGKTTLCLRYTTGKYYTESDSTIGIAFFVKKLDTSRKTLSLNIWDTAGSERYNTFTKTYLRGAKYCLICFDEFNLRDVEKYVEMCKLQTPTGEIILVVTKYNDEDNHEDARLYSSINRYKLFFTSSESGQGIDELFEHIGSHYIATSKPPSPPAIKIESFSVQPSLEPPTKSCC